MKIAYASDLHLEIAALDLHSLEEKGRLPHAEVLLLAGGVLDVKDLQQADQGRYRTSESIWDFYNALSKKYPLVYQIAGNHEYYGMELDLKNE